MRLVQALGPEGRAELADAIWDLESPEALMEWIRNRTQDPKAHRVGNESGIPEARFRKSALKIGMGRLIFGEGMW